MTESTTSILFRSLHVAWSEATLRGSTETDHRQDLIINGITGLPPIESCDSATAFSINRVAEPHKVIESLTSSRRKALATESYVDRCKVAPISTAYRFARRIFRVNTRPSKLYPNIFRRTALDKVAAHNRVASYEKRH
jgi:hypothetical protein